MHLGLVGTPLPRSFFCLLDVDGGVEVEAGECGVALRIPAVVQTSVPQVNEAAFDRFDRALDAFVLSLGPRQIVGLPSRSHVKVMDGVREPAELRAEDGSVTASHDAGIV